MKSSPWALSGTDRPWEVACDSSPASPFGLTWILLVVAPWGKCAPTLVYELPSLKPVDTSRCNGSLCFDVRVTVVIGQRCWLFRCWRVAGPWPESASFQSPRARRRQGIRGICEALSPRSPLSPYRRRHRRTRQSRPLPHPGLSRHTAPDTGSAAR